MIKRGIRCYRKISKGCRPQRPWQRKVTEEGSLKPNLFQVAEVSQAEYRRSSVHKGTGVGESRAHLGKSKELNRDRINNKL